jgi:hypothetical protein
VTVLSLVNGAKGRLQLFNDCSIVASMQNVTTNLRDAAYVAVGLGVIGYQRAQARAEQLRAQLSTQRGEIDKQVGQSRERFAKLAKDIEQRFEPVQKTFEASVDSFQERLPERAKELFTQARVAAEQAQTNLRTRLNGAAA